MEVDKTSKEKHVRIRGLTYSALARAAQDLELSISELADRMLTDALSNLEEEDEDQNENGTNDELGYCPRCGESMDSDFQFCPMCGEQLEE